MIALTDYSQMSTHVPGFQSFFRYFASLCIGQISNQHIVRLKEFINEMVLAKNEKQGIFHLIRLANSGDYIKRGPGNYTLTVMKKTQKTSILR